MLLSDNLTLKLVTLIEPQNQRQWNKDPRNAKKREGPKEQKSHLKFFLLFRKHTKGQLFKHPQKYILESVLDTKNTSKYIIIFQISLVFSDSVDSECRLPFHVSQWIIFVVSSDIRSTTLSWLKLKWYKILILHTAICPH